MRQIKTFSSSITLRDEESVNAYLKNISKTNPLTVEEETELFKRIKNGDQKAYDKLIESNLRFVVSVAKMFKDRGLPLADLIEEGNIGLMNAINKFDINSGYKFISYAVWDIRQAIQLALNENSYSLRMPADVGALVQKIKQTQEKFLQEHDRYASVDELSEIIGKPAKKIQHALDTAQHLGSLDEPIASSDDDTAFMVDIYNDDTQRGADADLKDEELHNVIVNKLKAVLPLRDANILMELFGIGCQQTTVTELSMRLGLTTTRINQIRNNAIEKLRNCDGIQILASYL